MRLWTAGVASKHFPQKAFTIAKILIFLGVRESSQPPVFKFFYVMFVTKKLTEQGRSRAVNRTFVKISEKTFEIWKSQHHIRTCA